MMEPKRRLSRPRQSPSSPPGDAAEEHAGHLDVDEPRALGDDLVADAAEVLQAGDPDDAEEDQVVDVDEVAERADDDGGVEEGGGDAGLIEG